MEFNYGERGEFEVYFDDEETPEQRDRVMNGLCMLLPDSCIEVCQDGRVLSAVMPRANGDTERFLELCKKTEPKQAPKSPINPKYL